MADIAPLDQTTLSAPQVATAPARASANVAPTTAPSDLDPGVIPSPLSDPTAWSSVTVSGITIGPKDGSGLVRIVDNAGRPYKWQIKDAAGQDGGTSTFRGKKPPEFGLEFHLWTDRHFAVFQSLVTTALLYDATKTTMDAVDIYHPGLAMVGLTQILVDDIGVPVQQGDRKMWHATIKVHEYFPPVDANVTSTPEASASGDPNTPGQAPDPNADLQAAVAAQLAENTADGVASPEGSGLP